MASRKRSSSDAGAVSDSLAKRAKNEHKQTFKKSYTDDWPFIEATKDAFMASCQVCSSTFSISHGGVHDIKKHVATQSHQNRVKKTNSAGKPVVFQPPSLTEFMKKKEDLSVIRAEALFTRWLVAKNLPLAAADDAGDLFR